LIYFELPVLERLLTEQRNPESERIDAVSTEDLLAIINREDRKVALAVEREIPSIAAALDAIAERYQRGGRLFYVGAGTSGRLGVLDAAECPPTFGVTPERVQGVIAGGEAAVVRATEASEDHPEAGAADLEQRGLTPADAVVGITASGRTPYVLGAVEYAKSQGALTVGLSTNPDSELSRHVDIAITPVVGPEVITGSTRLKSGTAQKLVLNMISTGLMVKMGYVLGNLMVNLQLKNEKLLDRARRIVMDVTGCGSEEAVRAIEESGRNVRLAVLMAKLRIDRAQAERRLADAGDNLWRALGASGESHRFSPLAKAMDRQDSFKGEKR
jgi:N-acetylmuramic acid 6-phosphate etherase